MLRVSLHWIALVAIGITSPLPARADAPDVPDVPAAGAERPPPALASTLPAARSCAPLQPFQATLLPSPLDAGATTVQYIPLEPCPPAARTSLLPTTVDRRKQFLVPAIETAGTIAVTMAANRYVGHARWAYITPASIEHNLHAAWVLDDDQFSINQLGHPYQGMFPYTAARSSGFGFWSSAAFVLAASTVWEIAGETEPPAVNDQFTTTLGGVALGEVVHRFAGTMRAAGGGWRVAGAILDPFAEVNSHVIGNLPDEYRAASESVVAGGASVWTSGPAAPMLEARPRVVFVHRMGLPGDASLRLKRPFDHFDLETGYGGGNALMVRIRGLLAGRTFGEADATRGLWGLFLSYGYDSPPPVFRTSTTALGLGVSAVTDVAHGVTLEGTALASGVFIGTAGEIHTPPYKQRDYVMGPGAEGLVQLRLDARDRVTASLELRQTAVFGVDVHQGDELILYGRARLQCRVSGPHGIAAEYSDYRRFAHDPFAGSLHARGDVTSLYYTYSYRSGAHAGW